ncbi:MAG: hypothetical protein QRY71_04175, partial [Candidatus Rhabdochlamydia sp.]
MTIRPYSLITAESASLHQENLSSVLEEEKSSKKLRVETLKTEQIANVILETNPNKDVSIGVHLTNAHEINKPLSDQYSAKKESLLQAINCHSKDENAYCNLADLLKKGETIEFFNGESCTQKELYLKAIALNLQDGISYNNLANCLKDDEIVQLLNGEGYTKKELYLKAIQLNSQEGDFHYNLAKCLKDDETIQLLNGETYTRKELYLKAIQLNPGDGISYYNLTHYLKDDEMVQLLSGEMYTKKELYLKAIQLNPEDGKAYCNLAHYLKDDEIVQFSNGESYTQKELCLKAIQLNPQEGVSYNNLAHCLNNYETVQLLNGESYTKKELYLKAAHLNPQKGIFYNNLAHCLNNDETVQLLSGDTYTKKELCLKAIQLDPQKGISYSSLANLLEDDETVHLLNGKPYTKKDLYCKAIDLDSNLLNFDQTRQYLQKFYIQEIEKNPKNIENHFGLIEIIQNISIFLKNEEIVDGEFLFKEALDIDPTQALSAPFAPYFLSIANHLHEKTKYLVNNDISLRTQLLKQGASLTLKNGEVISVKALYQHALSFLSLADLKYKGDAGIGDYLSYRKYTVLQDGTKFRKLMAYLYAYKKHQSPPILMKIGDALHPEQRVLLNEKFYDKRTCYEEASLDERYEQLFLRQAESLYPHEYLRREELVYQTLECAYQFSKDRLAAYTTLARVLSQYELKELVSKYLFMFKEDLQGDHLTQNETSHLPIAARIPN